MTLLDRSVCWCCVDFEFLLCLSTRCHAFDFKIPTRIAFYFSFILCSCIVWHYSVRDVYLFGCRVAFDFKVHWFFFFTNETNHRVSLNRFFFIVYLPRFGFGILAVCVGVHRWVCFLVARVRWTIIKWSTLNPIFALFYRVLKHRLAGQ